MLKTYTITQKTKCGCEPRNPYARYDNLSKWCSKCGGTGEIVKEISLLDALVDLGVTNKHPALKIKKIRPDIDQDIPYPKYAHIKDSGIDLHASIDHPKHLLPGEYAIIPTGISIEMTDGYEAQIRPKSGLSFNNGVVGVLGTVDNGYTGELMCMLVNITKHSCYTICRGNKIAQMVIARVWHPTIQIEHGELSKTERGAGGFGSTGK